MKLQIKSLLFKKALKAKNQKVNPNEVAKKIVENIEKNDLIEKVS